MLDFTKTEKENIKFLFDYIQLNGSKNLSHLFRINFLKIDEVSSDYISIIYNCFQDLKKENKELKQILKKLDFKGVLYV